jgi:hypothetical protein
MSTVHVPTITETSTEMTNATAKVRLIQEALSRARMRRPQVNHTPEAHRSARQIAMRAHQRAARELGGRY